MASNNMSLQILTCCLCCSVSDEDHKPVRLACSHDICFQCLLSISKNYAVVCPSCWNMTYIDSAILGMEQISNSTTILDSTEKKNDYWCLTCRAPRTEKCASPACSTIKIDEEATPQNIQDLQELMFECCQLKTSIFVKRNKIEDYLKLILGILNSLDGHLEKIRNHNNSRIQDTESFLKRAGFVNSRESVLSLLEKVNMIKAESEIELKIVSMMLAGQGSNSEVAIKRYQAGDQSNLKNKLELLQSFLAAELQGI